MMMTSFSATTAISQRPTQLGRLLVFFVCCCCALILPSTPAALADSGIRGPPHISGTVEPQQTFRIGETVKLECPIQATPPPMIEWYKDGESIAAGWERYKATNHGLRIKDLILDDSGEFTCKGVNGFGTIDVSFRVIVIDPNASTTLPPEIIRSEDSDYFEPVSGSRLEFTDITRTSGGLIQVPFDGSLRLRCAAQGSPEPQIIWYKNNKEIDERRSSRSTLQIDGVRPEDSGTYSCRASNKFGIINATFIVEVYDRTQRKPEFVGSHPQNLTLAEGSAARLQCRVRSDDAPFVQWLKRMERITPFNSHINLDGYIQVDGWRYRVLHPGKHAIQADDDTYLDKLVFNEVSVDDSGAYLCVATNSVGYSFREAYIQVYPTGAAPPVPEVSSGLPMAALIALPIGSIAVIALVAWTVYYVKLERKSNGSSRKESRRIENQRRIGVVGDNKDLSSAPCLPNPDGDSINRIPLTSNAYLQNTYAEPCLPSQRLLHGPGELHRTNHGCPSNSFRTNRTCPTPALTTSSSSNIYREPANSIASNANWSSVHRPPPYGRAADPYPMVTTPSDHAYASVHSVKVNYVPHDDLRHNRRFQQQRVDMV